MNNTKCGFMGCGGVIASCLSMLAVQVTGAPPVLTWEPSVEGNMWNAVATNWLDASANPVVWQTGAEARFAEPSGGFVEVGENIAATNLTFTGNGYTLRGAGLLTVEGALSAAAATASRIDTGLRSTAAAGLAKTGAGTLTLGYPNATLVKPVAVNAGTLALQNATLPGTVSVASSATLAVRPPATNGLMGFYYDVTPTGSVFSTLTTLEAHAARLTPAFAAPSGLAGDSFDFGATGALFPLPYGSAGSRTNNFEVIWRGLLTVPSTDYYTFRFTHDDGILLAIDRKMIINRMATTTTEATVHLETGPHDMVLGYYQGFGACGLRAQVKTLYDTAFTMLPNAWLTPYSTAGQLSGVGTLSLADGAAFNVSQTGVGAFGGTLAGLADSLFSKTDPFTLALVSASTSSNAFAGRVAVQAGTLAIHAPERIGDAATVVLGGEAALLLAADETLGALTGAGTVALGGAPSVNVYTFTDDANCGISAAKTYTHLLDFPDNGGPATVNGVTFTAAGMSGSANGYSWSTINPPNSKWADGTTNGITQLLWDFAYGSVDYTITLAGLTPGQSYDARLYFRSFGSANPTSTRNVTFAFTAGTAFAGSVNYVIESATRSIVSSRYTADAAGTLAIHVLSHHPVDACHLYGLSNEEVAAPSLPEPAPTPNPAVAAFTNDADSGLSTLKTYTHLLDFPANGNPAIVNGVAFTAAALSGSAGGYAWSTVTPPGMSYNNPPIDSTRDGIDRLLWDFSYNSTNFTLTLSGLYPGQTYETRLYFRSFGNPVANSSRDIICTFTAGATSFGSVDHDLDTLARSMVRCRYTADAAGTLAMRVVSINSNSTCHVYALSNEMVPTTLPSLTLDTPAGVDARHTGAITGGGTFTKRGPGTQRLGGVVTLDAPLDVQAGTLALEAGASARFGAVVQTGATLSAPSGDVQIGWLGGTGTFNLGGVPPYPATNLIRTVYYTNDIETGISTAKTYTHLIDLGTRSPTANINGVAFAKVKTQNGELNGFGWANFPPQAHSGAEANAPVNVPVDSGIYDLLYDMDYGWSWPDPATMQLTGLVPGHRYEVRFYNRGWGQNLGGSRTQTLTFDPDGEGPITETVTFNPDNMLPNYIGYRYTAASSTLAITVLSANSNQTYHIYGLSNEEVADAVYVPVTLDFAHDCTFAGTLTGAGGWVKAGPALLTLCGSSDASGPVAVLAGTLAVDVTGTLGGDITVASNALLHAGSETACGTLAVGGDLTLAPGALLTWRYTAAEADFITVGGTLTFPTNGILQISALESGIKPPALRPLIVAQQPIIGPADLTGWSVAGENNAFLMYSDDRTAIYFHTPRGTLMMLQ